MAKLLKDETARRLMAMLNARDFGMGRLTRPQAGQRFVYCLCDDDTAIGGDAVLDECYPATVLLPASDQATPPELSGAVLLTVLGSGGASVVPVVGMPYFGVLSGDVESDGSGSLLGRPRVFGLPFPSAGGSPVYGQAVSASAVSITPNGTWVNVGLSGLLTLPDAGVYEVIATTWVEGATSSGSGRIDGRVWNVTDAAVVETIYTSGQTYGAGAVVLFAPVPSVNVQVTKTWTFRMEVDDAKTLRLEVARLTGSWLSSATIAAGSYAACSLQWKKIE